MTNVLATPENAAHKLYAQAKSTHITAYTKVGHLIKEQKSAHSVRPINYHSFVRIK